MPMNSAWNAVLFRRPLRTLQRIRREWGGRSRQFGALIYFPLMSMIGRLRYLDRMSI